jgi:hypothetical protein
LRAFGLAAIAAAAAVNPAASISRLIAALAILSSVALLELPPDLLRLLEVLAIAASLFDLTAKAAHSRNGSEIVENWAK